MLHVADATILVALQAWLRGRIWELLLYISLFTQVVVSSRTLHMQPLTPIQTVSNCDAVSNTGCVQMRRFWTNKSCSGWWTTSCATVELCMPSSISTNMMNIGRSRFSGYYVHGAETLADSCTWHARRMAVCKNKVFHRSNVSACLIACHFWLVF